MINKSPPWWWYDTERNERYSGCDFLHMGFHGGHVYIPDSSGFVSGDKIHGVSILNWRVPVPSIAQMRFVREKSSLLLRLGCGFISIKFFFERRATHLFFVLIYYIVV